ncbi:MAG: cell division protein FtsZ [Pseudomonadota bacterium]|nr:cell division protein FtsZ [Pseudomonadota bacterium]
MTINLSVPQTMQELRPRITVVGVGGAGGNAVNNMINSDLDGVDFLVTNTDGQALAHSLASRKIQLGSAITQGLGAGSKPDVGRAAAEESIEAVMSELADCNMVFITAGMGGGTGTGAAPVIARAARERGILTVGVITKPFDFEGQRRMAQAEAGIAEMQSFVDTLIVIPNQNLFRLANERTTFADAFHMADTVLHQGVAGVTDLMIKPGQINLDFADIRAVMSEMGKAMMGTGEASGDGRATQAAEAAINNPLLDDISMQGASAVLINVTGGMDMTLFEVDEAANRIRKEIDADSVIIFGSTFDEKLEGVMRVSIVATGIEANMQTRERPTFIQAPITRKSTIISAPTAMPAAPAARADAVTSESKMKDAAAESTATVTASHLSAADDPAQLAPTTTTPEEAPAAAPATSGSATESEDGAIIPGFVPTKASRSRLAFLSAGQAAPKDVSSPTTTDADGDTDSDDRQMSIDEAITKDHAAAFGSGMPASSDATPPVSSEPSTAPAGAAAPEPVMVADSADELTASRRPFIPGTPAAMPDEESVPDTAPAGGKTSLINKISRLWTETPKEETTGERREPDVEAPVTANAVVGSPVAGAASAEAQEDTTPSILDLPRADAMSRMPEPAGTTTLDRPADDLEIPAFLRRQAN